MEIKIYKEKEILYNHNGEKTREIDKKLVDIIGLEKIEVHEILEKLALSLRRKLTRYKEQRYSEFTHPKDLVIFKIVDKLRYYFPENYGLRIEVNKLVYCIKDQERFT